MQHKRFLIGLLCAGALCAGAEQAAVDGGAAKVKEPKPDMAAKRLAAIDTDGNGRISLEEFKAMSAKREEERFKKLDRDGSGDLTKEEFFAPPPPFQRPKADKPAKEKKDGDPAAVKPAP